MKKGMLFTMLVLAAAAFLAAPLTSYAGGTITGKVTYTGQAEEKEFLFSKFPNPKFCPKIAESKPDVVQGEKRLLKTVDVGKDGSLKAAVVSVRDIEDKGFMDGYKGTDVISKFCEFLPYTGIVVNKKNFHVENTDNDPDDPKSVKGVLHNPHSFEILGPKSLTVFNIALAEKGSTLDKMVKMRFEDKGSIFRLQCDQHEFMQSFFLPVKNAYYTVVKDDGTFEIKNVPAGKHKVMAWHPFAGEIEADVDVKDGATVTANFQIKK